MGSGGDGDRMSVTESVPYDNSRGKEIFQSWVKRQSVSVSEKTGNCRRGTVTMTTTRSAWLPPILAVKPHRRLEVWPHRAQLHVARQHRRGVIRCTPCPCLQCARMPGVTQSPGIFCRRSISRPDRLMGCATRSRWRGHLAQGLLSSMSLSGSGRWRGSKSMYAC